LESVKSEYKGFLNTLHGVKRYNEFKTILYSNPDSLINRFNCDFLNREFVPNKETLNICDIGGGDGKRIIQILQYLNQTYNNHFFLDFIEQSDIFCNSFIKSKSVIQSFSRVEVQNRLFEDSILNKKYDFIFLIHSIFTFQNPGSINKLLSFLNANGKIILFSNAQGSFLGMLKKILDNVYDDKRLEINDVKKNLKTLEINFQSSSFNTKWRIHSNDFKTKTDIILDWLSLGNFNKFSNDRKDEIYSMIIDSTEYINDEYWFKEKEEIIVIPNISTSNSLASQPYTLPSRLKIPAHDRNLSKSMAAPSLTKRKHGHTIEVLC
jgi:Methyltransferase domain